jgi:hypothetical protein
MDNCGFKTTIKAIMTDTGKVKVAIESECENIQKMAKGIDEVDPFQIMGRPFGECPICEVASKFLGHPACLVPSAIVRTIEVESGMAIAGDSSVKVEKD